MGGKKTTFIKNKNKLLTVKIAVIKPKHLSTTKRETPSILLQGF